MVRIFRALVNKAGSRRLARYWQHASLVSLRGSTGLYDVTPHSPSTHTSKTSDWWYLYVQNSARFLILATLRYALKERIVPVHVMCVQERPSTIPFRLFLTASQILQSRPSWYSLPLCGLMPVTARTSNGRHSRHHQRERLHHVASMRSMHWCRCRHVVCKICTMGITFSSTQFHFHLHLRSRILQLFV